MRNRYVLVATFAAGVTIACSDAAVGDLTAPRIAAKPATSLAGQWPFIWEYSLYSIPNTVGIQVYTFPHFEQDYSAFVVDVRVTFTWANSVGVTVNAQLKDTSGKVVNDGGTSISYSRFLIPVQQGDTTFTVRVSTNGRKCGLIGAHDVKGHAAQMAINTNLVSAPLWIQETSFSGQDVMQPPCTTPDECSAPASRVIAGTTGVLRSEGTDCEAPSPPPDGGGVYEDYLVCYNVWRELWIWDYIAGTYQLETEWFVTSICYTIQELAT